MQSNGVSSAEFLLRENGVNNIWIVEAKSSSPKKLKCVNPEKNLVKYIEKEDSDYQDRKKGDFLIELWTKVKHDTYFEDVKAKFNDVLALIAAISLGQLNDNSELPKIFYFSKETKFFLVLIIKHERDNTCPPELQSLVEIKLKPLIKIWNLSPTSVKVMNENQAIEKGLINKSS